MLSARSAGRPDREAPDFGEEFLSQPNPVLSLLPKFHAAADNRNSHDEQDIADDRVCD